jgi:hypothetical protein
MYALDLGISTVFADESVNSVDGVESRLCWELLSRIGNSGSSDASGSNSE